MLTLKKIYLIAQDVINIFLFLEYIASDYPRHDFLPKYTQIYQTEADPGGGGPPPPKLKKIRFFGLKSWIFTRNTPKIFAPPSARRKFFKIQDPPLPKYTQIHYFLLFLLFWDVLWIINDLLALLSLFVHEFKHHSKVFRNNIKRSRSRSSLLQSRIYPNIPFSILLRYTLSLNPPYRVVGPCSLQGPTTLYGRLSISVNAHFTRFL
jgi:hypothetical protein